MECIIYTCLIYCVDKLITRILTFNLQAPGKYVSFIPVSVLNCP